MKLLCIVITPALTGSWLSNAQILVGVCVCVLTHLIIVDEQQNPKTAAEKKRSKFFVSSGDGGGCFEFLFFFWCGVGAGWFWGSLQTVRSLDL